ncbi:DUF2069 domain-containing protein [Uliginosibacterium gangwonense]|uniref:DUF2069 domain-containing protein n=1 Tax=Uliginosibacterium gangwonense TaxID=392736 RepID=UPI00036B5C67|nr:DUF2069 domain-containing protein [Uliginosibacterium gangwonense]
MTPNSKILRNLHWAGVCSLFALVALCLATELWLNPLRPGGSWLVLKALPLLASIPGFWQGRRRSFQWMSLLIWLYFMEGVVRATSDLHPVWGMIETILALGLYALCAAYARLGGDMPNKPNKQD